MVKIINRFIKNSIRKLGIDICRLSPSVNPAFRLLKGLEHFGIDLVLDVGANKGQFATELFSVGYQGRMVSFEPLVDAHQALVKAAASLSRWDIHPRSAIGDIDGEIEFNIAGNSVSSSALPMLDAHATAAAGSFYIGKIKVPSARLDAVAETYLSSSNKYLIKIDTQGFEWSVLDGGPQTLAAAAGVHCELSLVPLYEGQRLWMEMIDRLKSAGFMLWSIQNGFTDQRSGRTLQIDATFFRIDNYAHLT